MNRWLYVLLVFALLSVACGDDPPKKTPPCNDGATEPCSCDDGASGTSTCSDGSFGSCECEAESCSTDADCEEGDLCVDSVCELDSDGDGIADSVDNCPETRNADQADEDEDGIGDVCDDSDGDGLLDLDDNCPRVENPDQADLDSDDIGDVCDADQDGDGVDNVDDNCPLDANPNQADANNDGIGDRCDSDLDAILDVVDNCPSDFNPTQSDIDDDQVGDACDGDIDGDGFDNGNDVCPEIADDQTDTDADLIGDACDDDDDNDGLLDVDDNCPTVFNPQQRDRDNNGDGDVCADPDNDGIVDADDNCPDEANPDQLFLDADGDTISDCDERTIGTNPNLPDSDLDGLTDLEELMMGLNPINPDTDNDGLNDGDEIEFGLDPQDPSTFNDGVLDGDRPIVSRCMTATVTMPQIFSNAAGDWDLALPTRFATTTDLVINNAAANGYAGSFFEDATTLSAGVVIAWDGPAPANVTQWMQALTGSSPLSYVTHDGLQAWRVTGSNPTLFDATLAGRVFELAANAAPFDRVDFTNEPAGTAGAISTSWFDMTVVARPNQVVVLIAATANPPSDALRFDLASASDASNLATFGTQSTADCEPQFGLAGSKMDIYWLLDQSGSMSDDYAIFQTALPQFFADITALNIDVRHAVTTMDQAFMGRPRANVGWFQTLAQFQTEIADVTSGNYDCCMEFGLTVAQQGLQYFQDPTTPANLRAREDAKLVTVFFTDEEAQSIQNDPLNTQTGQQILAGFEQFFATATTAFGLLGNGICGSDGQAYRSVILATGGFEDVLCNADYQQFLNDVLATVFYPSYNLPSVPISSTLSVWVDGIQVPQSTSDGFTYNPIKNTVKFSGSYQPLPPDANVGFGGNDVTITYETFTP